TQSVTKGIPTEREEREVSGRTLLVAMHGASAIAI
ncbi:hypothetical protein PSYAR_29989, partial [Pseudomonas syringae pv. aceris str. M302273]